MAKIRTHTGGLMEFGDTGNVPPNEISKSFIKALNEHYKKKQEQDLLKSNGFNKRENKTHLYLTIGGLLLIMIGFLLYKYILGR